MESSVMGINYTHYGRLQNLILVFKIPIVAR